MMSYDHYTRKEKSTYTPHNNSILNIFFKIKDLQSSLESQQTLKFNKHLKEYL